MFLTKGLLTLFSRGDQIGMIEDLGEKVYLDC